MPIIHHFTISMLNTQIHTHNTYMSFIYINVNGCWMENYTVTSEEYQTVMAAYTSPSYPSISPIPLNLSALWMWNSDPKDHSLFALKKYFSCTSYSSDAAFLIACDNDSTEIYMQNLFNCTYLHTEKFSCSFSHFIAARIWYVKCHCSCHAALVKW